MRRREVLRRRFFCPPGKPVVSAWSLHARLIRSNESIPCNDATPIPGDLARPESSRRLPALVFILEIFGFTSEMRRVADDFAAAGYVVFIPNLFARGSWFPCVKSVMNDVSRGAGQSVNDIMAARQ
jgi:dienelactone hydrolase